VASRKALEEIRDSAAEKVTRGEKVILHLEACMLETASPALRQGLTTMLGSSLGDACPAHSTAGTMSILAAAQLGEDKALPIASLPDALKSKSLGNDIWKSTSREDWAGKTSFVSSSRVPTIGQKPEVADARFRPDPTSDCFGTRISAAADFPTKLLHKVQSKRRATYKLQTQAPSNAPALLTAVRARSLG
jgi:hypothetical protein